MNHIDDGQILPFQIGDTAVRGCVVRLGGAIDDILSAHDYPDAVSELVGQAAILATAMGASLKFNGKLILQVNGDGPVPMIATDYSANGALRAMASTRDDELAAKQGLSQLVGTGNLIVTIDQGPDMDRYQGVTLLEGSDFREAAIAYFNQSEQLPTAAQFAVGKLSRPNQPDVWRGGGIIAQFVPSEGGDRERGEEAIRSQEDQEIWERASVLLDTTQADELIDPEVSAETLLYRLFHEDGVKVFNPKPVFARCDCNAEKISAVLGRYDPSDLADMLEDGAIRVTCEFCRRQYAFGATGREITE